MEKDDWKLLQSKYSGVYLNCSSIAHHNEFASKAWTGVYRDVADRKSIRFQSSTRIHQARRIQKRNTLESGSKRSAVSVCGLLLTCGLKVDSYPKIFQCQKTYGFDEAAFDSMRGALAK